MKGYLDQCMNEWISEWLLKWKRNYCRCLNWKYDVQWSQWSWCWSLSHFALSPLSLSPSSISSSFPNHDSHNSDSVFLFYNSFSQSPSQLSPPHFCPLTFAYFLFLFFLFSSSFFCRLYLRRRWPSLFVDKKCGRRQEYKRTQKTQKNEYKSENKGKMLNLYAVRKSNLDETLAAFISYENCGLESFLFCAGKWFDFRPPFSTQWK